MERQDLIAFLRKHTLMVEATTSEGGAAQAAVVGFVVSDELELFFDTLATSRKYANLKRDPRIAVVVGWDDKTAQLEGVVDEPTGADLDRLRARYFATFPDGVERARMHRELVYLRVRPTWVRFSDFSAGPNQPATIVEVPVTS